MNIFTIAFSSVFHCIVSGGVLASDSINDIEDSIRAALPATTISSISKTAISGVFEVVAGQNIYYSDASGQFLFVGHLYDLHTAIDITQARLDTVRQRSIHSLLNQLPKQSYIDIGRGEKRITLLFDPLCGWCKRLYSELRTMPEWRVRVVFSVPPNSLDTSMSILCHKDPASALSQVMEKSTVLSGGNKACYQSTQKALTTINTLVKQYQLLGTPYLITDDGRVRQGYLPKEKLLAWFNQRGE
jgi:thiol:disulfide interchange protein DsbC